MSCSSVNDSNFHRLPADDSDTAAILRELAHDVLFEAETIDSIPEKKEERAAFRKKFELFLDNESMLNPTEGPGFSWSGFWPPKELKITSSPEAKNSIVRVDVPDRGNFFAHSIHDTAAYVSNRIGPTVFDMVKENRLKVSVFGGDVDGFLQSLRPKQKAYRVPSLYESWGIHKILVVDSDGRSRLHFIIPPISEYLKQYAYMLKIAGDKNPEIVMDKKAHKKMVDLIDTTYSSLIKFNKPTHVFMGYAGQFETMLKQRGGAVEKVTHIKSDFLGGVFIDMKDARGQKITLLGVTCEKTLWGEASAALASAIVKHDPEALYFLGSAGTLDPKIKIYSVSIPRYFDLQGQKIDVQNVFLENMDKSAQAKNAELSLGGIHGNSAGPAEQTIQFTDKLLSDKIDTIDVEQSLVAQVVANHNMSNPTNEIFFGAANIVTDRPATTKFPPSFDHNLDGINNLLKQERRLQILNIMYDTTQKLKFPNQVPVSCTELIREFFMRLSVPKASSVLRISPAT